MMKRGHEVRVVAGGLGVEEPDHRHHRLLRARRERPRGCAAKRGYQFPPADVDWYEPLPCRAASEAYHNADRLRRSDALGNGSRTCGPWLSSRLGLAKSL